MINNKPIINSRVISEEAMEEETAAGEAQLTLSFLVQYKFYIILGIIILIVLIILISYWKEIVDFFEEEDEGRKRRT